MKLSAPIFKQKRQAKLMARNKNIPLHQALDRIAIAQGFRSWSHLAAEAASGLRPAEKILGELCPGDMLLLGARPGHGKTLLGLELAALASQIDRKGLFFTLDYNEADVLERFVPIGTDPRDLGASILVDTSDDTCADHIIDRLSTIAGDAVVVVDYLQLLDQKRSNPSLEEQVRAMKAYADTSRTIFVMISQIDRSFELRAKAMPSIEDVRLPNPLDLTLFDKMCFLHNGQIRMGSPS